MSGKVNTKQVKALTMIWTQIIGNGVAIKIGGVSGSFELNLDCICEDPENTLILITALNS